jgi:predicted Zn finger-like uncharacterized protein
MAEHVTRCPHCQTSFRLRDQHLDAAGGKVRCGSCLQIFNAKEHLLPAGSVPRVSGNGSNRSKPTRANAVEPSATRANQQKPNQATQSTSQDNTKQATAPKTQRQALSPNRAQALGQLPARASTAAPVASAPTRPTAGEPSNPDDLSALQEVPADDLFDSVFDGAAITDSESDSGAAREESLDDYLGNSDSFEDLELSFEELLRGSAETDAPQASQSSGADSSPPPAEKDNDDIVFHDDMDDDDDPVFDDTPGDDLDDDPFKDFGTSLPTGGNRLSPTEDLELDIDESLLDMPGIESKPIGKLDDEEDNDDEAWARALLEDDSDIPESISKELNLDQMETGRSPEDQTDSTAKQASNANAPTPSPVQTRASHIEGQNKHRPDLKGKNTAAHDSNTPSDSNDRRTENRRTGTDNRTQSASETTPNTTRSNEAQPSGDGSSTPFSPQSPATSRASVSSNPFDDLTASLLGTAEATAEASPPSSTAETGKAEPKPNLAFALADDDSSYSTSGSHRLAELTEGLEVDPLSLEANAAQKKLALGWLAGALAMMLLMLVQVAYFQFSELSREQAYRPYYASICAFIGCRLPSVQNVDQMAARNLIVRTHPSAEKALVVDALIINHASFEQPFPDLLLLFKDINGKGLASRRFKPSEYLAGEMTGASTIPSGIPVHIALEIRSPGMVTIGHEIRLLANQW